jgi:hypothetical protein
MLELVDRIILRFIDFYHKRSSRFSDKDPFVQWLRQNSFTVEIRVQIPYGLCIYMGYVYIRGYSLTGKTVILHIINLGSSPNISNKLHYVYYYHN